MQIVKQSVLCVLCAALIYLSAKLNIHIPGTEIPQSAQTLAILIIVALLPNYYGVLAVSFYLVAGLLGMPVFSNAGYGLEHILGPTGGYLVGFLLAAIFISISKQKTEFKNIATNFFIMLLAHVIILFFGWLWLSKSIGMNLAFVKGVEPFVIGGIVKSVLAGICVYLVLNNKYLPKKSPKNNTP